MIQNQKIRCLIIDDEPPAREILKQHIAGIEALVLAGTCASAVEAISFLNAHPVDLLFLDIQMPQLLGTNFIRTLKSPPKVIFTTAYRKYAVEGFELDAVDYLLKPISFERFLKSVNKAMQLVPAVESIPFKAQVETLPPSFLYFSVDRKMTKVFFKDILYIEALKNYIKIVTVNRTVITKYVLSILCEQLPEDEFLRIHRSYIVALNRIESYNADSVEVAKHELPIGKLFKNEVTRFLKTSSAGV